MNIKTLALIILIAVGTISLFGVVSLDLMSHGAGQNCPISSMRGSSCPSTMNVALLAMHHISAMQGLLSATVGAATVVVLLLSYAALLTGTSFSLLQLNHKIKSVRHNFEGSGIPVHKSIIRWLAMRNKRDTHVLLWAHDYIS